MKVFDVSLNDRKLCRAGVGADGVLTTMVTWLKLTGQAAKEARRLGHPLDEARMHVGGLRKNTHYAWVDRHLRAGDRVTIGVTQARRSDPPARQKRNDPKQDERREREYYLLLKRKYEGHRPPAARSSRADRDSVTTLLNVDLDIWSTTPLDDLLRSFGRRVFVIGNNATAAQFSGVRVERIKFLLFCLTGLMSGVAAVLLTSRLGSTRPSIAQGWELEVITMVVLGGVSILGGSGSIAGVVIAAFIMGLVTFGMGLLNVPGIVQSIFIGLLLIVVIALPIVLGKLRGLRR